MKSSIKLTIRYYIKAALKVVLYAFRICSIKKNKIVFESFGGKQMSCNPYYIYEYLKKESSQLDLIWISTSLHENLDKNGKIKYVKYYSPLYFYSLMTCKYYITNDFVPYYIPFRKKQVVINTWHGGGAYKKVGSQLGNIFPVQRKIINHIAKSTTYFLSSSKVFTEIMSLSTSIGEERFLSLGMPRNDLFFHPKQINYAKEKVCHALNILMSPENYIVLYAPTFRNTPSNPSFKFMLDINKLQVSIKERFHKKNIIFLFRGHHSFSQSYVTGNQTIINVSNYPFMQELLCAADMLISDYSSCIWDYSFTYRPCILFTPDLKDYESDRTFYRPIKDWGFPFAETNEELCEIIESFDEKLFYQSMKKHHDDLQSCETGQATRALGKLILSQL